MDSSVYKKEIAGLKFRKVDEFQVLSTARSSYSDQRIRQLCSESSIPLDVYIRVLSECTPIGDIDTGKLAIILESNNILQNAVKQNPDLIKYYQAQVTEERALPILAVEEIVIIVVTALLNGAFSEIAKALIQRFQRGAPAEKKEVKKALNLLLSNSLFPLLETNENGLTINEIAQKLDMKPEDVGFFLAKYEAQGWIKQVKQEDQITWKLKKSRKKIIDELIP